jgi:hypothetical protein
MKSCVGCVFANWDKTKTGRLHPSGKGACEFEYKMPPLPQSMYWFGISEPLVVYIERNRELKDHCVYFRRADAPVKRKGTS